MNLLEFLVSLYTHILGKNCAIVYTQLNSNKARKNDEIIFI